VSLRRRLLLRLPIGGGPLLPGPRGLPVAVNLRTNASSGRSRCFPFPFAPVPYVLVAARVSAVVTALGYQHLEPNNYARTDAGALPLGSALATELRAYPDWLLVVAWFEWFGFPGLGFVLIHPRTRAPSRR
jgi:hypothetical protein